MYCLAREDWFFATSSPQAGWRPRCSGGSFPSPSPAPNWSPGRPPSHRVQWALSAVRAGSSWSWIIISWRQRWPALFGTGCHAPASGETWKCSRSFRHDSKDDPPPILQNCDGLQRGQATVLGQVAAGGADRAGEHRLQCHHEEAGRPQAGVMMHKSTQGRVYPAALNTFLHMRFFIRPGLPPRFFSRSSFHFLSGLQTTSWPQHFLCIVTLQIKHTHGNNRSLSPIGYVHLNETPGWGKNPTLRPCLFFNSKKNAQWFDPGTILPLLPMHSKTTCPNPLHFPRKGLSIKFEFSPISLQETWLIYSDTVWR